MVILEKIIKHNIEYEYTQESIIEGFGTFVCVTSSQKGFYPANPSKKNQYSLDIRVGVVDTHFFTVCDCHGPKGDHCSQLDKGVIGDVYE